MKKNLFLLFLLLLCSTQIQAQEHLYINEDLNIGYSIPEGFKELDLTSKNSLLRIRQEEGLDVRIEINIAYIYYDIPYNTSVWDEGLFNALKQTLNNPKAQKLQNTISCEKHTVLLGKTKRKCIKNIREFNIKSFGSTVEYIFIHKGGLLTVTINAKCPSSQIHNYEKYINNLTVESK